MTHTTHSSLLALLLCTATAFSACSSDSGEPGAKVDGDGDTGPGDGDVGDGDGDISVGDGDIIIGAGGAGATDMVCGNGVLGDTEACDDGNEADGDGCPASCLSLEPGFTCPKPGEACQPFAKCGDGIVSFPESCDDEDLLGEDGCSANCKEEIGYRCDGSPSTCTETTCGDGIKEGAEACEHPPLSLVNGQAVPFSGCSSQCQVEPDCSGASCTSKCGDGLRIDEACDDGNKLSGDGCSSSCEIEEGYTCESKCDIYDPDGDGEGPCYLRAAAIFRDFNQSFTDIDASCSGEVPGMVLPDLVNGKPVFSGSNTNCIESTTSFAKWYTSASPENATIVGEVLLFDNGAGGFVNRYGVNGDGRTPAQYNSLDGNPLFFPVDNTTLGLTPIGSYIDASIPGEYGGGAGGKHNFHFTTEVQYWFTYSDDMDAILNFEGDDDVWVFINGHLAVDLGGIHGPAPGSVRLFGGNVASDDSGTTRSVTAASFGLTDGNVYQIKVFQAERHQVGSSFKLTLAGFDSGRSNCTSYCGDGIIGAGEECDDMDNDGGYNECQPGCVLGGYCGDGQVQGNEACDDGDPDKPAGCSGCRILVVR